MNRQFQKKHKKLFLFIIILIFNILQPFLVNAQRFPKPEFENGYLQPEMQIAEPRTDFLEYFDVFVLFAALSLVSWLVLKKRSRKGVFWVSVFSVLYFGFYREGCVCSVGAIQNIALGLVNSAYQIPFTVIAFFSLPLIFALFFGRVFCAGVCPLGAIQDFFALKPVQLKAWLQKLLGVIPYFYFGLAVLYAVTETDFIICRYDPFVGIFRLGAEFSMYVLAAIFLMTSIFVARPYCRFFCPYSVLLNLFSKVSKHHLTITPKNCIQCRLCENSCPFGAIEKPEELKFKETRHQVVKRFIILGAIVPLLVGLGAFTGIQFHERLARVNPTIRLAEKFMELEKNPDLYLNIGEPIEIEAFKTSGKTTQTLYKEAADILENFYWGGLVFGAFIGLVFGLILVSLSVFHYRKDYEPNKGTCLSCARCMDYCPIKE